MKKITKSWECLAVSLMLACPATAQVSDGGLGSQDTELIVAHKAQLGQACGIAMTNVLREFEKLAQRYPSLSDIGSASIVKLGSPDSGIVRLDYWKNVSYVQLPAFHVAPGQPYPPGTEAITVVAMDGTVLHSGGHYVVDKGGAGLGVSIQNADEPQEVIMVAKPGQTIYPLLLVGRNWKLRLVYSLELNPSDSLLDKALRDIVEKQVSLLRSALQDIVGIDPILERAIACGTAMSNIKTELKGLSQRFPAWSDIGSASVENRGGRFLYNHLRYWKDVQSEAATNSAVSQAASFGESPVVLKGGVALDVYILNEDEPFGVVGDFGDSYHVFSSPDGRHEVVLSYELHFNRRDQFYDSVQICRDTARAVQAIFEKQALILRKKMDNRVDFSNFK
ncbi:MAG: hypothetical protein ABSA47_04485 [Verrucomicrobiota bacterium]